MPRLPENPNIPIADKLKIIAIRENTAKVQADIGRLSDSAQQFLFMNNCFDNKLKLKYNVIEANGCVYLVDPLSPNLKPGEQAVYPFHDEAAELLKTASSLHQHFDTVIDAFRGGGHSTLPILKAGIADKGKSIDVNPRALELSKVNAVINGLDDRTEDTIGDTTKELPAKEGKTLFVANPPFALAVKDVRLEQMRDGGANGLTLTNAYLKKAIQAAETGDVIIGVAYSRIGKDGSVELERKIKEFLGDQGTYEIQIVEGEKLWRGPNGKKEQPNPMPLDNMYTKAKPEDTAAIESYKQAAALHKAEGWEKLGYYRYIIRVDKTPKEAKETRASVGNLLTW